MNYATESDDHLRRTIRSLYRTLGLLTFLVIALSSVYDLPF